MLNFKSCLIVKSQCHRSLLWLANKSA